MIQERRVTILEMLEEDKLVKVSDLVERFGVSIETVRRDLEYLERQGLLNRVYGGALPLHHKAMEPTYRTREVGRYAEKKAIGEKAVETISDGDVIFIDIGTTTLEFSKALVGKRKITVITNSMKIAMVLSEDNDIRVIMIGGVVRNGEFSVSGYLTNSNMSMFNTDKVVLGVGGLSISKGITDYHVEESNLRRLAIANTQKVIALADYTKIGTIAMNNICDMDSLDILVTDSKVDGYMVERLQDLEVEVIQVEVEDK